MSKSVTICDHSKSGRTVVAKMRPKRAFKRNRLVVLENLAGLERRGNEKTG